MECKDCRFFLEENEYGGYCRRFPPQVYGSGGGGLYDGGAIEITAATGRPWVGFDEWCGEWASDVEVVTLPKY